MLALLRPWIDFCCHKTVSLANKSNLLYFNRERSIVHVMKPLTTSNLPAAIPCPLDKTSKIQEYTHIFSAFVENLH